MDNIILKQHDKAHESLVNILIKSMIRVNFNL